MKNILIRCDSSSKIGLGHVKRTLLLAQRLKASNEYLNISFATQNLSGNINIEILNSRFTLYTLKSNNIEELSSLIATLQLKLLIIDSYDIDYTFEKRLKTNNPSIKILSFDDLVQPHYADIILNHSAFAKEKDYASILNKSTKLLCGSKYTLLRDEFFIKQKQKVIKNSIAIILGGNDILNCSFQLTQLLLNINPQYAITIITSSVNPNLEQLNTLKNIELLIDIKNIAKTLAPKELIICASGGTLFEILALRKKFINIQVVSNQQEIVDFLNTNTINTTIEAQKLTQSLLEKKLCYVFKNNVYEKLSLKFSKNKLTKKILKLLT